eukprot:2899835-Amphidinium_carterae.2
MFAGSAQRRLCVFFISLQCPQFHALYTGLKPWLKETTKKHGQHAASTISSRFCMNTVLFVWASFDDKV